MDLSFSVEQEQLRDTVTSLLDKHSPPERVRAAEPLGFDPELWDRLAELGVPSIGFAEAAGGLGGGLLDLGVIAAAAGRFLASAPVVESCVATRAVAALTGDAGGLLGGPVLTFCPRPVTAGATAPLVRYGAVADTVVAKNGDRLVLVGQQPSGTAPASLGCAALGHVDFDGPGVSQLAAGDEASARFEVARDEWFALSAAALAGLAAAALDLGVDYVKARHQFGVPIGSFQSVAHRLADVAAEVDGAALLWQKALWSLDEGEPRAAELARMAFANAAAVAERASLTSLHFHGGYGFMLEYDIQLYARRAKAWGLAGGGPNHALDLVADAMYGPRS